LATSVRDRASLYRSSGQEWTYSGGNDGGSLTIEGAYGTASAPRLDQVNMTLYMTGHPGAGAFLQYARWDGRVRRKQVFYSKGNLERLGEFVDSLHGDRMSIGLFIPFPVAWNAVRQFMETDGELPDSIEWVASTDLPRETFPMSQGPGKSSTGRMPCR
jgi:hypothetical protein